MIFEPTPLEGLLKLHLTQVADERGWFVRTFCTDSFAAQGLPACFVQTNHSFCEHLGTLRGLHYQHAPHAEAKLVRCVQGRVYDVAVDVRRGSPTFLRWFGTSLSPEVPTAVYVPPGFAHGYLSLSEHAAVIYQSSESYHPELEGRVRFDDPMIGIDWPLEPTALSPKDAATPWLEARFEGMEP